MVSASIWLMNWPRLDVNLSYLPGEKINSTESNKHVYVGIMAKRNMYMSVLFNVGTLKLKHW